MFHSKNRFLRLLVAFAALVVHTLPWSCLGFFSVREFLHLPKRWESCAHEGKRSLSNMEFIRFLLSILEYQADKFSYALLYCNALREKGREGAGRSKEG